MLEFYIEADNNDGTYTIVKLSNAEKRKVTLSQLYDYNADSVVGYDGSSVTLVPSYRSLYVRCKALAKLTGISLSATLKDVISNTKDEKAREYYQSRFLSQFEFEVLRDSFYDIVLTDQSMHNEGVSTFSKSFTKITLDDALLDNVTTLECIFATLENLEYVDLKNVDFTNIKNMSAMFDSCGKLKSFSFNGADLRNVSNINYLFLGCLSLEVVDISNTTINVDADIVLGVLRMCTNLKWVIANNVSGAWLSQLKEAEIRDRFLHRVLCERCEFITNNMDLSDFMTYMKSALS